MYGRFAKTTLITDIGDQMDLRRRTLQAAVCAGMLGQKLGLGLKSNALGPFDGYDITDQFPVSIKHGAVNTDNMGHDGYWVCLGVTWEGEDNGNFQTTLTLRPPDGGSAPSGSLLDSVPISPQDEWQVGWTPPNSVLATAKYWLDQNTGKVYARGVFGDPLDASAVAGTTIDSTAHGFSDGDPVYIVSIDGGSGLYAGRLYFVVNSTSDTLELSLTVGGAAVSFTTDIASATIAAWPEYSEVSDGIMDAPSTPAIPDGPILSSAVVAGTVLLTATIDTSLADNIRLTEVQITRKYTAGPTEDYDGAHVYTVPKGSSYVSISALGGTNYWARSRVQDVFGNYSAWSSSNGTLTLTGADALNATTADEAAGLDHEILSTEISDGAITTPKLFANAVTAAKIAVGSLDPSLFGSDPKNLVPNPGGEAATVNGQTTLQGWTLTNAVIRLGSLQRSGNACFQCAAPSSAAYDAAATDYLPVMGGRRYRLRGWYSGYVTNASTATGEMSVLWYDQSKAYISAAGLTRLNVGTSATYVESVGTVVAPTTAVWAVVRFGGRDTVTIGDRLYLDDVEFTLADQDVSHAGGNVVINSSGVTITNGKLTFQDSFGSTSMDGGGFGGSWVKFLVNRVYNGDFGAGSTSDIPVSEVGGGSGTANYAASISPNLPYWVVSSSDGTLKIVSDSTATGGTALQSSCSAGGQTNTIYQDIPVAPGETLRVLRNWRMTRTSNDVTVAIYMSWRKSDHSSIASAGAGGLAYDTTISYVQDDDYPFASLVAPSNASYLRYEIHITHNTGTGTTVWISDVAMKQTTFPSSASCDTTATLSTTTTDVSGCSLVLGNGTYLVIGCFDFECTSGGGNAAVGVLNASGFEQSEQAIAASPTTGVRWTSSQTWVISVGPADSGVVKLRAKRSGTGSSWKVQTTHTTIRAIPIP